MPSVKITVPESGDPFPDPISGTYDLAVAAAAAPPRKGYSTTAAAAAGTTITVTVTRTGESHAPFAATVTPGPGTDGTWECKKPNGLTANVTDYVITADLKDAGDTASHQVVNIST